MDDIGEGDAAQREDSVIDGSEVGDSGATAEEAAVQEGQLSQSRRTSGSATSRPSTSRDGSESLGAMVRRKHDSFYDDYLHRGVRRRSGEGVQTRTRFEEVAAQHGGRTCSPKKDQERRIIIYKRSSSEPYFVDILSPQYEPLRYPLLFPSGEEGWSPGYQRPGMKKALNLARKYDLPTKTRKKMTKKAHDHDHAVAGVADVVEDGIVTTVEIENRLPSQITTRIPF